LNSIADNDGTLPKSGDMANGKPINEIVRIMREVCGADPSMPFYQAMAWIFGQHQN
jgi:hypothetical protein